MKYIVMQAEDGSETLVAFSRCINHDAMEENLSYMRNQTHGNWKRVFRRPISAGFIAPTSDGFGKCFGHSETLGLESRPEIDTKLLTQQYLGA